jgi:hypothetical protein
MANGYQPCTVAGFYRRVAMSNHKWQVGPVKLANGNDAFIDAINEGQEHYRYTGRMMGRGGFVLAGWHSDGRLMWGTIDHPHNLAPPPKKKVRVKAFFNCYENGTIAHHCERGTADRAAGSTRIACKEIDIEVEEGEGL